MASFIIIYAAMMPESVMLVAQDAVGFGVF
jgi:hypothetical protein